LTVTGAGGGVLPSDLLSRFPLARCDDLDEFLPLVHQAFGVPRSHPVGPKPRRRPYELRGLREPQFTIGLLRNAIGVSIDGSHLGGSYFINFGVSGTVLSERGGDRLVNCPEIAAVFNPGDDHLLLPDRDGTETLGIRLDHALVARELAMLLGREPDGPVAFDFALDLTGQRTAALRPVIDALLSQLDAGHEVLQHPAVRLSQVRTFVTTLLLTHEHSFSDQLRHGHSPPRPRNLRGALGFIEAHLAEPMTLGDIARAAGCSARTLNDAFHEHFAVSPMARVRQLRLDAARAELLGGGASVTEVAGRWGFSHLSRFSGAYHERFGELPSQTLRRG
jgi:AraC-like DNA-binding protein